MEGLTVHSDNDNEHGDHDPVDPLTLKFQELRKRYYKILLVLLVFAKNVQ